MTFKVKKMIYMRRILIVPALFFVLASYSQTYYIVRHAEKAAQEANMTSDVPLNEQGKRRAEVLSEVLKDKDISHIYTTNTIRTKSTAQPTADKMGLAIESYGPRPDSVFIGLLKSKTKNTLIVGHSNTIDDIVNMLTGNRDVPGDLPDSEYNKLFIVEKKGSKYVLTEKTIMP
jgi:phosphohistidine phosphatase SixA